MLSNCGVWKLLRVPWTARRSNQSILKEINPIYSLRGLILKLKLQCLGHLMPRTDSLEKTLMLGKIEGKRRRGQQRMRWLDGIIDSKDMNLSKLQKIAKEPGRLQFTRSQTARQDLVTEQQQDVQEVLRTPTAGRQWPAVSILNQIQETPRLNP